MLRAVDREGSGGPGTAVLLGRQVELRRLRTALGFDSPTGRFIAVLGEPGIGKTSLIETAVAQGDGSATVLSAAADEMGRRWSYRLLADALAPLLGPGDDGLIGQRNEYAVGERLHAVLDQATLTPTVLVLEDLQWADPASLGLLTRLSRTLSQVPLLVIGSLRSQARHETPPELDHLLGELSARGLLETVELGPLSQRACVMIAERLTGARVDGVLATHVSRAGGNPLFLTEMIRALQRDGAIRVGPGGEAVFDPPVGPSPSLAMVIMRHLSHLSGPTRQLLSTAALLGTRFPAADLRVAADRTMGELVPLLQEAFAAGILAGVAGDQIGFRHSLIQAVLQHDLPVAVRAQLHREIAIRFDAAQVAPSTVAEHLVRAPIAVADLPWMLQLAGRASTAAPDLAVQLWRRVADATAQEDPLHVGANTGLAHAALREGRIGEAVDIAELTLQGQVPTGALAPLVTVRTHALLLAHRNIESRDTAERYALSEVLSPAERAAQLAFAGWPRLMMGDVAGAERVAQKAAVLGAQSASCGAQSVALTLLGLVANCRGDLDRGLALLTEAVTTADEHPCLAGIEVFPHGQLAVALADVDRVADATSRFAHGLKLAAAYGYRTGALATHTLGAVALSHTGNLPDLAAELAAHDSLSGHAEVPMDRPVLALWAHVLAHQQGPTAASAWAARLDPVPGREAWAGRGRSWIWLARSQLERTRTGDAGALGVLWAGWQELRAAQMLMDCAELALDLALLADAWRRVDGTSDPRHTEEILAVVDELAARNPGVTQLQAKALAVHGLFEHDREALVAAAELFATTPRQLEHARVAKLAALALPSRDARSRGFADTCLQLYAEAGADHELAGAREALGRHGVSLRRSPRARPVSGWESLTRTEQRVARQVATGATNPQIAQHLTVSRRTVESHVSNVLAKLGFRSRTELAVFVTRRVEDLGQDG